MIGKFPARRADGDRVASRGGDDFANPPSIPASRHSNERTRLTA